MSKTDVWYGYLMAGEKSSPVVRDLSLETKSPKTLFLYNHNRGAFLEYSLEIVQSKLRELTDDDMPLKDLKNAFKSARKAFLLGKPIKKWEKETLPETTRTSRVPDKSDDDIPMDFMEDFEVEDELEV